ncbi:MAG: PEGA domain-containing protein [Acidobacteriota bacterium]|nr:PEGA domain-containing protein [Acidobacteriota bacterium]
MEPQNQNPLDELQSLDEQIGQTTELAGLKPIFFRLDELAKAHSGDFEVQLAVTELKQKVVTRGTALKQLGQMMQEEAPGAGTGTGTLILSPTAPLPVTETLKTAPLPPPLAVSSTFQAPPAVLSGDSPPPIAPPPPPRAARDGATTWKRALLLGVIAGALVSVLVLVVLVNQARKRNLIANVPVQVTTTPAGAAIQVNGETKCNSNCSLSLPPGDYRVTAVLDGYQPAASALKVEARQSGLLNLTLQPQPQMVRILTDLQQGQVSVDGQPPADLQDGQFVINNIQPGQHLIKLTSKTGEASFTIDVAEAKMPAITGPVAVRDLIAVLVSSMGDKARVVTNSPAKLVLNGQAQGDASPAGVDVSGFRPGVNEIAVGEGKDLRTLAESFGPAPAVTAFLKSDVNSGTLIISTAEDNVRVFLNGKEYPRKTQKGQLRIPALGSVNVRVAKDGFEITGTQTAEVKKGSETRLEFKMQPLPQVAILQLREATPGAEVLLDQKPLGAVGDDGSFTANSVPPGEHTIELRKDQFLPKRMQRMFVAGKTVTLLGGDAALAAATGTVRVARTPADAAVVYRRADETQGHEWKGNQMDLPAGSYIFTARAAGYVDRTERVQLGAGETHPLELALAKVPAAPPPAPKNFGMADFEDPAAWSKQGDVWSHKGGGVIPYKLPANGTFTFTVRLLRGGSLFRGGRIRWAVQYLDAKNYDLFELDRKALASKVIEGGKTYDRGKFEHGLNDKEMSYTVQVDVSPGLLVHRIQSGENWLVLDTWKEPGRKFTEGKFAFLVQGGDEIGLSDFKFVPR